MTSRPPLQNKTRDIPAILFWGLALLPLFFLLAMFLCFGVDVPYLDQWELIPLLQKSYEGNLHLADFWAQHNEHRLIFPRLIMLALARWTHWDIRMELMVNFVLGMLLFSVAAHQVRKSISKQNVGEGRGILLLLSLLLFSLSQWQNWFLGWQLQVFLSLLCVITAIFALTQTPTRPGPMMVAMALSVVGSYSFANGMLVWPIGLVMLFMTARAWDAPMRRAVGAWMAVGGLTAASYLYDYHTPAYHPPLSAVFQHAADFPLYVLRYLGQPMINFHGGLAAMAGAIGLVLWFFLLWRFRHQRIFLAPYLGLGLYSLFSALVTGAARIEFGADQAMSSRYITLANPLWIANAVLTYVALFNAAETVFSRVMLRRVLGVGCAMLLLCTSLYGAYRWTERCHAYTKARQELVSGNNNTEQLRLLYPEISTLIERRETLKKYHLSVFKDMK
jgi:hypothetical protein